MSFLQAIEKMYDLICLLSMCRRGICEEEDVETASIALYAVETQLLEVYSALSGSTAAEKGEVS